MRHAPFLGWVTWGWVIAMIAGITIARLLILALVSPLELTADEAYYWDWSRRLELSYYSKGPGVAWSIWVSTLLFGDTTFAVRAPAAIGGGVAMLGAALLGYAISHQRRVAFLAAAAVALVPAYQATATLFTPDAGYIACWSLAAWLAFMWLGADTRRTALFATLFGGVVGIGFLFKYTALFLPGGVLLFILLTRTRPQAKHLLMMTLAFAVVASPVFIWNHQHGWPTVSHNLGQLQLPGGDLEVGQPWTPLWFLAFVGAQVGLLGVAGVALAVIASLIAWRDRHDNPERWRGRLYCLAVAAPIVIIYTLIAIPWKSQGNWAIAGYLTIMVLVADVGSFQLERWTRRVRRWKTIAPPRPKWGIILRRPETPFSVWTGWLLGIGIGTAVVLSAGPLVFELPGIRETHVAARLRTRIAGHSIWAAQIQQARQQLRDLTGDQPLLIADHYGEAGRLAFYLPDQPVVIGARGFLGERPSCYDFFEDTKLPNPVFKGRNALLVGKDKTLEHWQRAFNFERIQPAGKIPNVYFGFNLGHANPQHPTDPD